jgi:cell division protein FtsW (lipid II flippase)
MLGSLLLVFLSIALASTFINFSRYVSPLLRLISYALLMGISLLTMAIAYRQISPLSTSERLELRGQYFPLDTTIRISGDPNVADYYAPGLLVRNEAEGIKENPLIELSEYDRVSSFQAVAKRMARPLSLNGQILNMHLLSQQNQIAIGALEMTCSRGLFSGSFTINGQTYKCSWPRRGVFVSLGELLCRSGLSNEKQYEAIYGVSTAVASNQNIQLPTARENPLYQVWVVWQGWSSIGLINGSNDVLKLNNEDLSPEARFTVKSGDQLTYGSRRQAFTLKIDIEPTDNRIYLLPEKFLSYPLYHPKDSGSSPEIHAFISSTPTTFSPAYQLPLGQRNRDLVKGVVQYSFAPNQLLNADLSDLNQEEKARLAAIYQDGFIINSGFDLRSYKFKELAMVGSNRGGVLVTLDRKETISWLPVVGVAVIWVFSAVFFCVFGWVSKQNYLFVLMPCVHMLLALRLILSYRGYVLPPYLSSSYEKALFAAIFIPFAIFLWLYFRQLNDAFDSSRFLTYQRRIFGWAWQEASRQILSLPPLWYMLLSFPLMLGVGALSSSYAPVWITLAFFLITLIAAKMLSSKVRQGSSDEPLQEWLNEGLISQDVSSRGILSRILIFLNRFRLPDWDILWLLIAPILLAAILRLATGKTEELPFIGIRGELVYQPCLFLGSCRFYMWFFREYFGGLGRSIRWPEYFWLTVPLAAYVALCLVVGDWGFLIYAIPVLSLALIISWRAKRVITIATGVAISLLLLVILQTSLVTSAIASLLPDDSAMEYRYLAYQDPGYLQNVALEATNKQQSGAAQCLAGNNAARRIFQIHEHFWTMFHFAARGSLGVGYGKAPIERISVPDGIAQSDNTYSIYILSEHGSLGGIAVLSLYVFIALLMLFILTQHFADDPAPALLIGGIAITFLFNALYHAAGNVNALPFTGKNLPILSLNSLSDIIHLGLLLALALSIIGNGGDDLRKGYGGLLAAFRGEGNMLNRLLLVVSLTLALFFGYVMVRTIRAADDERYKQDYDLDSFIAFTKNNIDNGNIYLKGKALTIDIKNPNIQGLGKGQFLGALMDQFNSASLEEKKSGKYFFVVRDLYLDDDLYDSDQRLGSYRETVLNIDANYFKRLSPFFPGIFWKGGLRSSDGTSGDQGYLSGEGINLFFKHQLDSSTPIPGFEDMQEVKLIKPEDRVSIGEQYTKRRFRVFSEDADRLFDLYAIESDVVLEPYSQTTMVNGQEVRNKARLEQGDIIAIKRSGKREIIFVFERSQSGLLAHHQWVSGHEQYTYPQGEAFALARPIVEAINTNLGRRGPASQAVEATERPLTLSLSTELNHKIYERLVEEGNALWQEIDGKRGLPPRLAVTAMNPETGEVLAVASWPSHDPNPMPPEQEKADSRSYTNLMRRRDPESVRLLRNHNLTRHVLGSATKPFFASAVASIYPELLTLEVSDTHTDYDKVLGIPTEPAWHGNASGKVNWDQFLVKSNNLYAVTLGFLGLASGNSDHVRFTNSTESQPIWINGRQEMRRPYFEDKVDISTGKTVALESRQLAVKLQDLFDIKVAGPDADPITSVWQGGQDLNLLPEQSALLRFISPEMPNLTLNSIDEARQFVSICLGGKTNLWSNIKSAEAFSRLVTGRRVSASMVKLENPPQFDLLGSGFATVQAPLLRALEGVCKTGTASNLAAFIGSVNSRRGAAANQRFTIFGKTGTLEGQYRSGRDDSNFLMAAGLWDSAAKRLTNGVVLSIYIEKGDKGRAAIFARKLLDILNQEYGWMPSILTTNQPQ